MRYGIIIACLCLLALTGCGNVITGAAVGVPVQNTAALDKACAHTCVETCETNACVIECLPTC